jgi:hypothetical protein
MLAGSSLPRIAADEAYPGEVLVVLPGQNIHHFAGGKDKRNGHPAHRLDVHH